MHFSEKCKNIQELHVGPTGLNHAKCHELTQLEEDCKSTAKTKLFLSKRNMEEVHKATSEQTISLLKQSTVNQNRFVWPRYLCHVWIKPNFWSIWTTSYSLSNMVVEGWWFEPPAVTELTINSCHVLKLLIQSTLVNVYHKFHKMLMIYNDRASSLCSFWLSSFSEPFTRVLECITL